MNGVLRDWHPVVGRAIVETRGFPVVVAEAVDKHELLEREHYGAADITDIVIVANQLTPLDINDSEVRQALALLP